MTQRTKKLLEHPLDEWQSRLAATFDDVTLRKLELPQEPVTFALEHGLSSAERAELSEAIHASVGRAALFRRHYICWAVYAAELGYLFAGDEYWHTFEDQTPNWSFHHRSFIKTCFVLFAQEYNGAIPKGPWARHRSIICWPITHSILPKDLQRQLAEVLYRIRHSVVLEDVESPRQLGRLVSRHSIRATSRFRQLSSEPDLIGQIAAALLLEDQQLNLIDSRTLDRIAGDLNAEEQARSWLRDARRHLSKRAQIKGLSRRPRATAMTEGRHSQPPRPPLRPQLILRNDRGEMWRLLQSVPDLTPLVRTYPDLQPIIARANIQVGTFGRPVPARALLHGGQFFVQSSWPPSGQPLLDFQPPQRDLRALLEHVCTMEPGPWLFRIGVDGAAREIKSKRVADGGDYVIVGSSEELARINIGRDVTIECDNVVARQFNATGLDALSDELRSLGFDTARKVSAQPFGFVPAGWDREGTAEWLSTDRPLISLSANYAIDHYDIVLNVGTEDLTLNVQPTSPTEPVIIQLPELHSGVYHLSITAHASDVRHREEDGDMEIVIRDPLPADVHVRGRDAMMVIEEPSDATLQDVFEDRHKIQVIGPPSREVVAEIRLLSRNKVRPLAETKIERIRLPMTSDDWTRRLNNLMDNDANFTKVYQESNSCELVFDGADLGRHTSVYDRPFTPLRWGVAYLKDTISITLYDDTDDPQDIEIVRYEFSTPLAQRRVTEEMLRKAAVGEAKPGLYVARTGSFIASTIIPVQSIESLKSARPRFHRPERTTETVGHFLDAIDAWGNVSTTGNVFGRFAWRQSLKALIQQLAGLIGGTAWYKTELAFDRTSTPSIQSLANQIPFKLHGQRFPEILPGIVGDVLPLSVEERVKRFSKIVHESEDFCRFSLRLASDPTDIRLVYGSLFSHMLREVMRRSHVFRASRFLVLAVTNLDRDSESDPRTLYDGWKWK